MGATETEILFRANAVRRKVGLAPVAGSAELQAIARVHAVDMLTRGFFGHVNPDGRDPADRLAVLNRTFIGTNGENIGRVTGSIPAGPIALAARFHDNWMASDLHRGNVMGSDWTEMGIGVARNNHTAVAVQVFGYQKARLDLAAPLRVRRGDRLNLSAMGLSAMGLSSTGARLGPNLFDLWDPARGTIAAQPQRIAGAAGGAIAAPIVAPRGIYHLRFYFRDDGGFTIFTGPQISVQ
ncbi:MAG: CAP domain-containing protein [Alphaproteobacteria bacterium]|nr:CAP domain-containing protein [Alphaproteobacteria bacterium]